MAEVAAGQNYIKAETVRQLCGDITDMTLWRWIRDPRIAFPSPVTILRRRYWREDEIRGWLEAQRTPVLGE